MTTATGERVVVTGLGVVSALAAGREAHLAALFAGRSGVTTPPPRSAGLLGVDAWARVDALDHRAAVRSRALRKLLRPGPRFALAAAGEALAHAGLLGDAGRLAAAAAFVGSLSLDLDGPGFLPALAAALDRDGRLRLDLLARRGARHVDPLLIVKGLPNAGLGAIAIDHGIEGPNLNIVGGAASGLQAVVAASRALRAGEADVAVVGGYDSQLLLDLIARHRHDGELSASAGRDGVGARPFDAARDGFVVGEGAAFCVLEREDAARRRGAPILAAVPVTRVGFCPTAPDEAHAHAAAELLRTVAAEAPAAVFAGGRGSRAGDAREAAAIRSAWPAPPPVTAATGALGFTGAAASAFSFVHACHAVAAGALPPTVGCRAPDPALGVRVVTATTPASSARFVIAEAGGPHLAAAAVEPA